MVEGCGGGECVVEGCGGERRGGSGGGWYEGCGAVTERCNCVVNE